MKQNVARISWFVIQFLSDEFTLQFRIDFGGDFSTVPVVFLRGV